MMRVELTHGESTGDSASAVKLPLGKLRRSARRMGALQHNNGMHPTRISMDVMRKIGCCSQLCAGG